LGMLHYYMLTAHVAGYTTPQHAPYLLKKKTIKCDNNNPRLALVFSRSLVCECRRCSAQAILHASTCKLTHIRTHHLPSRRSGLSEKPSKDNAYACSTFSGVIRSIAVLMCLIVGAEQIEIYHISPLVLEIRNTSPCTCCVSSVR